MTTSDDDGAVPLDPGTPVPVASQDEQPTVVLAQPAQDSAYLRDDVLPAAPVRHHHRRDDDGPRRTTPTPLGRVLLPLALALVSAVGLVAAWSHLQDDRTTGTTAPITGSPSASGPAPSSSASPSPSTSVPTSSATVSASASPSSTASAGPVASSSAASPSASASSSARVDRSVPVVVLNSTLRTGLAARVAAQLRRDGWTVVSVGNYRGGRLAVTTVFAAGHADAVATIGGDLRGTNLVRQPVGAMSPTRLTVVIGASYPRA